MRRLLCIGLLVIGALMLVPSAGQASCSSIVYCNLAAIYCNGQSVCHSGPDWVQCDNQARIYCPTCTGDTTCCDGSRLFCMGWSSCQSYSDHIVCDGIDQWCLDCPNYGAMALPGFLESLGSATCG